MPTAAKPSWRQSKESNPARVDGPLTPNPRPLLPAPFPRLRTPDHGLRTTPPDPLTTDPRPMINPPLQHSRPGKQLAAVLILAAATVAIVVVAYNRAGPPADQTPAPNAAEQALTRARTQLQQLQEAYPGIGDRRDTFEPYAESVRGLVERNPEFAPARTLLAQILLDTNQPREALAQLAAGLELDGNQPEVYCLAGNVAQNLGDLDTAAKYFLQAIGLEPRNARYLLHLANVHLARHEFDEARDLLLKALHLDSSLHEGYAALSDVYASQNKLSLALTEIRKALEQTPPHERAKYIVYVRKQARLQLRDGRPADALLTLKALSMKEQFDAGVMADMATCLANQGRLDRAAELYENAVIIFPSDWRFLAGAAHWRLRNGDLDAFDAHLRALRRIDPNLPIIADLERQRAAAGTPEPESPTPDP